MSFTKRKRNEGSNNENLSSQNISFAESKKYFSKKVESIETKTSEENERINKKLKKKINSSSNLICSGFHCVKVSLFGIFQVRICISN